MNTTTIPLSRLASRAGLAARLPDFIALMKPRVMVLAVFTALVGLMIAPPRLDPLLGFVALLAIAALLLSDNGALANRLRCAAVGIGLG